MQLSLVVELISRRNVFAVLPPDMTSFLAMGSNGCLPGANTVWSFSNSLFCLTFCHGIVCKPI